VDLYREALEMLRYFSLGAGSIVVSVGILRGVLVARGAGGQGRVARRIGEGASLGLEFFVAATVLNLILNPTWTAVATTAVTILTRKAISLSLRWLAGAG
jgi:uncharacterized membrane protein